MSAGNTKRQLMCMEDFEATAFACTPSYAMHLAEAMQEAGVVDKMKIKLRCVVRTWTVRDENKNRGES